MDLAIKRSDIMGEFPKKMYQINFTQKDQEAIKLMTEKLYNDLENERRNLSLEELDNSTPKALFFVLKKQLKI